MEPVREKAGAYGGMLIDFWTPAKMEELAGKQANWDVMRWSKRLRSVTRKMSKMREGATEKDWADYQREVEIIQNELDNVAVKKKWFGRLVRWFEDNESDLLKQGRAMKFILQKKGVDAFRVRTEEIRDEIRSKK